MSPPKISWRYKLPSQVERLQYHNRLNMTVCFINFSRHSIIVDRAHGTGLIILTQNNSQQSDTDVYDTTATHCCSASATDYFDACSRCRTLPPAWSQAPVGVTTSQPMLRQLHWLPVRQHVVFKIAGLVHQSLVGLAPAYLADDCRLLSDVGRRQLWSSSNDMRKLLVPRTHNKLGDRSFSAAGPRLWNDLPPGLRQPGLTFDSFRQSLKTHLFGDQSA